MVEDGRGSHDSPSEKKMRSYLPCASKWSSLGITYEKYDLRGMSDNSVGLRNTSSLTLNVRMRDSKIGVTRCASTERGLRMAVITNELGAFSRTKEGVASAGS